MSEAASAAAACQTLDGEAAQARATKVESICHHAQMPDTTVADTSSSGSWLAHKQGTGEVIQAYIVLADCAHLHSWISSCKRDALALA